MAVKTETGYPIMYLVRGLRPTPGEVGIEIECEGNKFKKSHLPEPWGYHEDHSLRGKDNAEYVLKYPILFSEVPNALKDLWTMFEDYGTVLDVSNRTSVHVHLNVQKFHLNRLSAFLGLYFCLEEILTEWCGEHRVGNLFCLRAKDAPAIVTKVRKFLATEDKTVLSDSLHYAGLNANALIKFGSIEVRTLQGVRDAQTIETWVSILQRLYDLSAEYENDPRLVCAGFSSSGPMNFLYSMLGDKADTILNDINMSPNEIRNSLYNGIRMAQDLCYCRDWSTYKPQLPALDPFGRKEKQIVLNATPMTHAPGTVPIHGEWIVTPPDVQQATNLGGAGLLQAYIDTYGLDLATAGPGEHEPEMDEEIEEYVPDDDDDEGYEEI